MLCYLERHDSGTVVLKVPPVDIILSSASHVISDDSDLTSRYYQPEAALCRTSGLVHTSENIDLLDILLLWVAASCPSRIIGEPDEDSS